MDKKPFRKEDFECIGKIREDQATKFGEQFEKLKKTQKNIGTDITKLSQEEIQAIVGNVAVGEPDVVIENPNVKIRCNGIK